MTMPTTSLLPLTTTFTPDPGCSSVYLRDCTDGATCVGEIFRNQVRYCLSDPTAIDVRQSCFPETRSESEVHYTYSPGLICPEGMTTAASAISPEGVWCCPRSLSWVGYPLYCGGLMTTGTYITSTFACSIDPWTVTYGPGRSNDITALVRPEDGTGMMVTSTIPASEIVLSVYAVGVFLSGQTWSTSSPSPTSSTGSTSSDTASYKITLSPTSAGADQGEPTTDLEEPSPGPSKALIGAVVGSILGVALLLALGFFFIRRHRNKGRERARIRDFQELPDKSKDSRGDEFELEGSQGAAYKERQELDPNATRSELDNGMVAELDVTAPVELDGACVHGPESNENGK